MGNIQSDNAHSAEKEIILACVGMPGAGKSVAISHIQSKNIPCLRFGDVTDEGLKALGIDQTPAQEQIFREKLRRDLGMAAYAIKSEPKIKELLKTQKLIAIDGLYSWEEYRYLAEKFENLILIHIFAGTKLRHDRLGKRELRPFIKEEARERDIAELEKLNKGGPIAMSDFVIDNGTDNLENLHTQIDKVLEQVKSI